MRNRQQGLLAKGTQPSNPLLHSTNLPEKPPTDRIWGRNAEIANLIPKNVAFGNTGFGAEMGGTPTSMGLSGRPIRKIAKNNKRILYTSAPQIPCMSGIGACQVVVKILLVGCELGIDGLVKSAQEGSPVVFARLGVFRVPCMENLLEGVGH